VYNKYLNSETLKWSIPNVFGSKPVPKDGHSACIIGNCMYIFGGFQEHPSQFSQDLYMLNLHTKMWSIIKTQVFLVNAFTMFLIMNNCIVFVLGESSII